MLCISRAARESPPGRISVRGGRDADASKNTAGSTNATHLWNWCFLYVFLHIEKAVFWHTFFNQFFYIENKRNRRACENCLLTRGKVCAIMCQKGKGNGKNLQLQLRVISRRFEILR